MSNLFGNVSTLENIVHSYSDDHALYLCGKSMGKCEVRNFGTWSGRVISR